MIKFHLSRIMGEKKINQAQLSRMTGIRPGTISELYNEFAERISFTNLNQICEALNCDVKDLIEYVPGSLCTTRENLIVEEHGNRKKRIPK